MAEARGPLGGITVVDCTAYLSGPYAAMMLADMGASVVKVESLEGDSFRELPGFYGWNRGKRSVAVNLKEPAGRDVVHRLAKTADVVMQNTRPGVAERLGVDSATLRALNPRLIYCAITAFGPDGPYRDRPGFDQIAQGMGGLMSITGLPGQGPVRVGIPVADLTAGLFCALGILVALLERESSGEGQWVSTSLLQAQIFMLDFQAARWLQAHEVPKQAGNNHPTSIPTGVFKTKDGHINIASTGQVMWERLCNAIEAPELIKHPDYATGALRSKNRDALNAEIEKQTVKKTSAQWIDNFNKIGVPCGPIYAIDQMFADEQVKHLAIAQGAKRPDGSDQVFVGQPIALSRTPSKIVATPPSQGQHTDEVLKEFGFADGEIAELHKAKAV